MTHLTNNWGWPQWAILVCLFLHFLVHATNNGKPALNINKTGPVEYNAFVALARVAMAVFFLACGGFFS